MLDNHIVEQRILEAGDITYVSVEGDGYHYQLVVVSDRFLGKSLVARQQWVYQQLKDYIASGALHALTMKTWTNAEWEKQRG